MSILKIVDKSQGSHDKVIYVNIFVMSTSLTKFQSCITW